MILPIAFGFGNPVDWAIIFVVALIVFGPQKLPEVGKQLGQALREFRKITDELTGTVHSVRDEVESAYKPILTNHTTSSPTVERVIAPRKYDQDPKDLMAPVVSDPAKTASPGLTLSTLPPAADDEDVKGH